MRFRMLGSLEVLSPDGWTAINAPKWRSLLACLLLRPGQLVPTDSLIFEVWGETPPSTANNLVSIYIHRLKKLIGDTEGKTLVYRAPGYMLRVAPGDVDVELFESLAAKGRTALAADPERAATLLGEALALWRAPFLADVPRSALVETHVNRMTELRSATTELRVAADLERGRPDQVIPELRGLVAEHPMRERLWALLIRALDESGRHAEALETYAQARQVIADELGVDPGSELQRLYARLLTVYVPPPAAPGNRRGHPAASRAGIGAPPAAPAAASAAAASGDESTAETGAEPPGSIAIGTFAEPLTAAEPDDDLGPDPLEVVSTGIPRPAQLPADIGDFTGRETHVEHLCALLVGGEEASSPGAVRIAVVNGAAGLGKTTLAVHAAHQVSGQFPDGQLYVDLLGASSQAASPGEVLARFLRDLGIEGSHIPAQDEARAALFRSILTGRQVLVVLDNAKDAAQVRPLLPGSKSCAVLVTTRNRTSDLASMRFFDLDVLEDIEALALFSRIVGEERAAAEPDATGEILVACAGLPLAIRICAARLAKRRQWRISTLADRLRDQHRRLDEMKTGDLAVRASFQVSYETLRPTAAGGLDPARVFRLLGLWQGEWISGAAAAALIGAPEGETAEALEALVDINLLESPAPEWYRFHDLLRAFAVERAQAEETEAARTEAVGRLLRWYLASAEAAADTISPHRYQVVREAAAESLPLRTFADTEEALDWYDGERTNIVSVTRQAAGAGLHEIAWRLPVTSYSLFTRRGNWADCVTTQRIAAESVRRIGNRLGEAWALNQLGFALARMGDSESFGHLEHALAIRRELGDTAGEAQTALALGEGHLNIEGPGQDALRYMQHAVDLRRPAGSSLKLGVSVNNLGDVYFGLGNLDAAAKCFAEAREIFHEIGGYGEGHALHNLGRVYMRQNRFDDAVSNCTDAIREHRAAGDLVGEAIAFKHLGEAHELVGDTEQARTAWLTSLSIFERIGDRVQSAGVSEALAAVAAPATSVAVAPDIS
jgi:DNA-binding SARP family transcriptional activator/tetratricopeptide (TPR) repeat protein